MFIMLLIYLVSMGLCIWFGPKLIAVLDRLDVKAEVTPTDALAGLILGVIPVLNIFFVFFGGWILAGVFQVLKEGTVKDMEDFNSNLKEMFKNE
jgi:hypothetical protein